VAWLLSSGMSDNWKTGDLLHNKLSTGRLTSWNEKLREGNSLWSRPVLSFPELPLLFMNVNIVIEDSDLLVLLLLW